MWYGELRFVRHLTWLTSHQPTAQEHGLPVLLYRSLALPGKLLPVMQFTGRVLIGDSNSDVLMSIS